MHCQRNTTGEHCEKCLDGYIGDSIREHPDSASRAPVLCPTWPILQNPAIGKMELFGAFVKKIMLDLTVKGVLLVTMETPYSLEAPVRNVTAVEIQIPT